LADLFRFWRGNFRVRLKFVKSKLHLARLMIVFFPGKLTNATIAQAEYAHREIVDLAAVDELVYELPFTSKFPYLSTRSTDGFGSYGSFQIIVLNPLQAPPAVANNVNIIVETAMGEGCEFFHPLPITDRVPVIPQAGDSKGLVKVSTLSDAKLTGQQEETSQLCVGEKLLSLRQLVKYPNNMTTCLSVVQSNIDAAGVMATRFYKPYVVGSALLAGTSSVRFRDFLGILQPYFRFSRGSMRVRIRLESPTFASDSLGVVTGTATQVDVVGAWGALGSAPVYAGGDFSIKGENASKFLLPPWQVVPMVPLFYTTTATTLPAGLLINQTAFVWRGVNGTINQPVNAYLQRQPADDYELLSFIGPPLTVLATA
jgi:hypothetical protein